MKRVLVIAPHPDDETLGCGGTLLRHAAQGDRVNWLIVTGMTSEAGYSGNQIKRREKEMEAVTLRYGFKEIVRLGFPTTRLDQIPVSELIRGMKVAFEKLQPQILYVPHAGDVHTDHRVVCGALDSCAKWFRCDSIERILSYETLSETGFSMNSESTFRPNVYVNITEYLDKKISAMRLYAGETGRFPFPRSKEALRSLALLRGAESGFGAAEGFMLLRERIS